MATRPEHKKENQFPRNFLRKNFGEASNKDGFIGNTIVGAFTPYCSLGVLTKNAEVGFITFLGSVAATCFGAYQYAHTQDTTLDFTPEYEVVEQHTANAPDGVTSNVYQYNDSLYLLRHTEEGVQLYKQLNWDDSLTDDIFVLLDQNKAPAIAREIGEVYKGIVEQQNDIIDIWSAFESVRTDEPIQMQYEGISSILLDTERDLPYIIADDVQVSINEAWTADSETAQAGFADWESALQKMAKQQYISYNGDAPEAMPLNDMDTSGFLTWLALTGGIMGLGAAGGATYSIGSSRRRFNKELGIK